MANACDKLIKHLKGRTFIIFLSVESDGKKFTFGDEVEIYTKDGVTWGEIIAITQEKVVVASHGATTFDYKDIEMIKSL